MSPVRNNQKKINQNQTKKNLNIIVPKSQVYREKITNRKYRGNQIRAKFNNNDEIQFKTLQNKGGAKKKGETTDGKQRKLRSEGEGWGGISQH